MHTILCIVNFWYRISKSCIMIIHVIHIFDNTVGKSYLLSNRYEINTFYLNRFVYWFEEIN